MLLNIDDCFLLKIVLTTDFFRLHFKNAYDFICVDSSEWFNQKLIELDEFPAESEVQGVWIGLQGTYIHM